MVEAIIRLVCDNCGGSDVKCKMCGHLIDIYEGTHDCTDGVHVCQSCKEVE